MRHSLGRAKRFSPCLAIPFLLLCRCSGEGGGDGGQATAPALDASVDLIANPSFEVDTRSWGGWHSSLARWADATAPDGAWVVKVSRATGTSYSIDDSPDTVASVPAGAVYEASAWVRAANFRSVGAPVFLNLREKTSAGEIRTWSSPPTTLTSAWQKLSVSGAAPGAGHVLDVYVNQNAAKTGHAFYADAFVLHRIDGAAADAGTDSASSDSGPPVDSGSTGSTTDAGTGTGTGTDQGPRFPRLGAYPIGGAQGYDASAFRDRARKYHVVIVTHWPGWQTSRSMTMAQVVNDIKTRSTVGTKVFTYVVQNEQPTTLSSNDAYYPVWQKLNSERWWLYPTGTSGTPVASTYPGASQINNTNFTHADASGKNWIQWKTDFDLGFDVVGDSKDAPDPYLDGFFLDNVFWKPRVDGDFNVDGTTDSQSNATVAQWLREGAKSYFDYVRSRWPGGKSLQLGNIADWGDPSAVLTPLDQVVDGGVMEGLIGESWSVETWGGFTQMMAWYRKMIDACRAPKLAIFGQNKWASGDYRSMRYGLASTLMDDGYFYLDDGNYDPAHLAWFDEFDFDLGYPLQTRREAAWSQGVWRRDFDNGIVLVNPKGNGPRTVSLGGTYRKLAGAQDPATNDGSTVTSVTLADRDAIILRR